ncbi:MAG: 50S ribosomal protein L32 [Candidatus Pacebacteria bacterium]|nr:50S ribosomal protein L32 [Candidatus Paceibacterota bacterium]
MAVQQCKVSKRKVRCRTSANHYQGVQTNRCPSCGEHRLPHRVCPHCGNYRGRQVLTVSTSE